MRVWIVWALLMAGRPALAEETGQERPDTAREEAQEQAEKAREAAREKARAERDRARAEARHTADQRREATRRAGEERKAERERMAELYDRATELLYDKEWEKAAQAFSEVAEARVLRADDALYWKAYAQAKGGRTADALATLERLRTDWPGSRWQRQARALAVEIRPDEAAAETEEDDLRLIALGSLLDGDPARSIPALEKILAGPSHGARERAVFVLSQSGTPEARQLLLRIARGEAYPNLQGKAIEYVGLFGNAESRKVLDTVYASATARKVKEAVLRGYMLSGNKEGVLAAARSEKDAALRAEAIRQLGIMGARQELVELLGTEKDAEARKAAFQALFLTGDAEKLVELTRTEKDPALRAEAARTLGLMDRRKTGPALVALCRDASDAEVRGAALQGLFIQQNDQALVEVARTTKDPALRREAVLHLSHLDTRLSREFLAELLDR